MTAQQNSSLFKKALLAIMALSAIGYVAFWFSEMVF